MVKDPKLPLLVRRIVAHGEDLPPWRQIKAPWRSAPALVLYLILFLGPLVRVIDGDTVEVLREGRAERVRLVEIDAPERNQPYGRQAKAYVLRYVGQEVRVEEAGRDRYGRVLGEVFLPGGESLNRRLVRDGMAWWYRRYSTDASLGALEAEARRWQRGLWRDPAPVPPWEFR